MRYEGLHRDLLIGHRAVSDLIGLDTMAMMMSSRITKHGA